MAAMFDDAKKKQTQFLKGNYPKTLSIKFGSNWFSFLRVVKKNVKIPIGSNIKLCRAMAAILDGARQNRT